ncbi:galactoside O-acetyltransferase [uncultured Helicobacter sp.]|uniref:acyltransferase n=1 Tax=uncultured Helicobacter sp. TaxID=175537 RepID=UPI00263B547B|nr:galactoside O-acetyltransferase [uncultured Helicobacter sp.]
MESFSNPIMKAQYNTSFYTRKELESFGFKYLGDNVLISRLARIYAPERMSIGNCVRIDDFAILSGAISLGQFIHISAHTNITGGNGRDSSVSMGDFCSLSLGSRILSVSDDLSGSVLSNSCVDAKYRHIIASHIHLPGHNHIGAISLILPRTIFNIGANLGPQSLVCDTTLNAYGYYFVSPARLLKNLDSKQIQTLESQFLRDIAASKNVMGGGDRETLIYPTYSLSQRRVMPSAVSCPTPLKEAV